MSEMIKSNWKDGAVPMMAINWRRNETMIDVVLSF